MSSGVLSWQPHELRSPRYVLAELTCTLQLLDVAGVSQPLRARERILGVGDPVRSGRHRAPKWRDPNPQFHCAVPHLTFRAREWGKEEAG